MAPNFKHKTTSLQKQQLCHKVCSEKLLLASNSFKDCSLQFKHFTNASNDLTGFQVWILKTALKHFKGSQACYKSCNHLVDKLGVSSRQLVVAGNLLWRWYSTAGFLSNHHAQNRPRQVLFQLLQTTNQTVQFLCNGPFSRVTLAFARSPLENLW